MIPCLFYDTEITLLLKDIFVSKSCLKSVKTIRIYFKSWKDVCVSGIGGLRFFPAQTIHSFREQNADTPGKALWLEPRPSVASVETQGDPAGSCAG